MGDPARAPYLGTVVRRGLAGASLGAGVIHASVVPDHAEHLLQLLFFVAVATFQVAWALVVLRRWSWPVLAAGAVVNAGVIAVWVLSRTVGLSGVPGADHPEPVGLKDGIASGLEFALVVVVGSLIPAAGRRLRLASGPLASWVVMAGVGALTTVGLAAPGHHHDEGRHSHGNADLTAAGDHHAAAAGHSPGSEEGAAGEQRHHAEAEPSHTPTDHPAGDDPGQVHDGGRHAIPHGAPGHVHIASHIHPEPGAQHPNHDHAAAHGHVDPGPDAAEPHHPEAGAGHDHQAGPDHDPHDQSGGHDHCSEGGPHPLVSQLNQAAQALGLGCLHR